MASSPPIVPSRPARRLKNSSSENSPSVERNASLSPEKSIKEPPQVPAHRPARRTGRPVSVSPIRSSYAPSPLNELPDASPDPAEDSHPGVNIPSVGQEGQEFEEAMEQQNSKIPEPELDPEPKTETQVQHIHAPRPSHPKIFYDANSSEPSLPHARPVSVRSSSHTSTPNREGGTRVPMYPNAGDVQAPSPSISRNKSKHNDAVLPPGSYGLHGHGARSPFEEAWYKKHPEELARKKLAARSERAFSSEELNQLVKNSGRDPGLATASKYVGTPDEETGYLATEELVSRMVTPHAPDEKAESAQSDRQSPGPHDHEDVNIHIDDPIHQLHHIDGYVPANEMPGEKEQKTVTEEEHDEYPIIAEDEAVPSSAHMPPAVSPSIHPQDYSHPPSHTVSRTASTHDFGGAKQPVIVHPPSRPVSPDEGKQYEPLFTDDDKAREKHSIDRFKRQREDDVNRFPSQDVWEDTSENLEAVQRKPDLDDKTSPFETPEQEAQRRNQQQEPDLVQEEKSIAPTPNLPVEEIQEHKQTPPAIDSPNPPASSDGGQQRFPSRDIWEDAPDSSQLVTTVSISEDQPNEEEPPKSVETGPSRPAVPARPARRPKSMSKEESNDSEQTAPIAAPTSPPPKETTPDDLGDQESATVKPTVPARPKPHVPSRPVRSFNAGSDDTSAASAAPQPKPKPPRPLGSKIAALQSSLNLSDRMKVGPKAPPKPKNLQTSEENNGEKKEEEKKPLSDVRKSRARGPTRKAPSKPKDVEPQKREPALQITPAWEIFSVDPQGNLSVNETSRKHVLTEVTKAEGDEMTKLEKTESETTTMSAIHETTQETHDEAAREKPQEKESELEEADSGRLVQSPEVKSENDQTVEQDTKAVTQEAKEDSDRKSEEKMPAPSDINLDSVSDDIVEAKDNKESTLLTPSVSRDSDETGKETLPQSAVVGEKENATPSQEQDAHPPLRELPKAHLSTETGETEDQPRD